MKILFTLTFVFFIGPAMAQEQPTIEFQKGYCKGYNDLLEGLRKNRDHFRDLLGQPRMTQAQVLKWIYERPWRDEGNHRTAPRTLGKPPGIVLVGPPAIESVDLYIMPPITHCSLDEHNRLILHYDDWRTR